MTKPRRNSTDSTDQPIDLFGSIKSKLAQQERNANDDGITVDLNPIEEPSQDDEPTPHASPVGHVAIGHVLRDRFVIEARLGSGGMGTVYKALDRTRSEYAEVVSHVAIKILHEETRGRPDAVAKLQREFYSAQALSHPNVVKVYELNLEQDCAFFTMEWIDGEPLSNVLNASTSLPRSYAWAVIRELGAGLAHSHERQIIHGDIKPRNIMVTDSGELRILDFGAAGGSTAALTPDYASCELLEGREPDRRDDLFALACLSYELLTGEHPFQHRRSTEARSLQIVAPRPGGLTARQWNALSMGLSWEREGRSISIRDWIAELEPGSQPLGPVPITPSPAPTLVVPEPARNEAWPRLLIALTAAIICVILWVMLHRPAAQEAMLAATPDTPASTPANADINALTVQPLSPAEDTDEPPAVAEAPVTPAKPPVAVRPIDRTERIGFESGGYRVPAGEKFAEIRVHRSFGSKDAASFEWRTEPASALADIDYVPQARTTMFFPAGKHTISIFIKVIPNAARKRAAVFHVIIDKPSAGTALSSLTKTAISLPPVK